jgi:hypothetical protein
MPPVANAELEQSGRRIRTSYFLTVPYSLSELMLRLGSYRNTRFHGHYGKVVSTPTKAQCEIFTAFGINVEHD